VLSTYRYNPLLCHCCEFTMTACGQSGRDLVAGNPLSPALLLSHSTLQLCPSLSEGLLCVVLVLMYVVRVLMIYIRLFLSILFLGYSYIFITVLHFISSWNQTSVLHWKLILIFVISMFVIITLAAVFKCIEILLHFEAEAAVYCQQCNIDTNSEHR